MTSIRPYSYYPGLKTSSSSCYTQQNSLLKTFTIILKAKRANRGTPRAFADAQDSKFSTIDEHRKEEEISTPTLIWRAIKLPIYSVALVPLTVSLIISHTHSLAQDFSFFFCSVHSVFNSNICWAWIKIFVGPWILIFSY